MPPTRSLSSDATDPGAAAANGLAPPAPAPDPDVPAGPEDEGPPPDPAPAEDPGVAPPDPEADRFCCPEGADGSEPADVFVESSCLVTGEVTCLVADPSCLVTGAVT